MSLNHVLFAIMALIWGATWIAIRAGIGEVPPVTFGAARYILVSAVLLLAVPGAWATLREPRFRSRVAATGLLVNALTYGLLFWGMQHVASGVAGLVNLSMIAVGLFGLAVLFGDERSTWRHAVALLLGVLGLVALFWGRLGVADSGAQFWGLAAIIAGTFAYCLGSVLSRPLLRAGLSPLQLSGAQAAVGAVGLGVAAALLEAPSPATLARLLAPGPPRAGLGRSAGRPVRLRVARCRARAGGGGLRGTVGRAGSRGGRIDARRGGRCRVAASGPGHQPRRGGARSIAGRRGAEPLRGSRSREPRGGGVA